MIKQRGVYLIENENYNFWKKREELIRSGEFSLNNPFNGNLISKNGVEVSFQSGDKTGKYLGSCLRIEVYKPLFRPIPKSLKTVLRNAEYSFERRSLPLRLWKDCVVPIFELFDSPSSESPYDLETGTKDCTSDKYLNR